MISIIRAIWPRRCDRLALGQALLAGVLVGAILLVNGLLALLILQAFAWLEELEAGAGVLPVMPVGAGLRGVWRRSPRSRSSTSAPGRAEGPADYDGGSASCGTPPRVRSPVPDEHARRDRDVEDDRHDDPGTEEQREQQQRHRH